MVKNNKKNKNKNNSSNSLVFGRWPQTRIEKHLLVIFAVDVLKRTRKQQSANVAEILRHLRQQPGKNQGGKSLLAKVDHGVFRKLTQSRFVAEMHFWG